MNELQKIASMLRIADPKNNSPYQERKNALEMARKRMDAAGLSYASLGFSQADAERIENQFSVTIETKPKKDKKENRISIFSGSNISVSTPDNFYQQLTPKQKQKPKKEIPDYEAENDRKQQEIWDRGYHDWVRWRQNQDLLDAQNAKKTKKFMKVLSIFLFVVFLVIIMLAVKSAFF